jgi:hypothetical protein
MHALSDIKIEAENSSFPHYISLSSQGFRSRNLKSHSLDYLQLIFNFTIKDTMFIAYLSSIALLLGLLSHSSAFEKRAVSSASTTPCISDNCLKAVSSAHFTGSADCSKYELAVATPSTR